MKIFCLIDSLGPGGAQRQLVTLAISLKRRGHEVRFLVYAAYDYFLPLLKEADIPCQKIPNCSHWWQVVLAIRKILCRGWQDVVLAFLECPCLLAELARIPGQRWGLVVGERSANPGMQKGVRRWIRQFHRFADGIVANSHTNRLMLASYFPFLRGKLTTVYNIVNLELFHPSLASKVATNDCKNSKIFRIIVAASYQTLKNMMGVAKSLLQIKRDLNLLQEIVIDWYGGMPNDATAYDQAVRFVAENGLASNLRLHSPTKAIEQEFSSASAIGLFSFFEGLPNAVCEGMACGKPIILSNVCDAGNLVRDGTNGFLCDPNSPESIANAIWRLAVLSEDERHKMGLESRKMAEELFSENIVIDHYERILEAAMWHKPMPSVCHWPAEVPMSAVRTVEQWADGA